MNYEKLSEIELTEEQIAFLMTNLINLKLDRLIRMFEKEPK